MCSFFNFNGFSYFPISIHKYTPQLHILWQPMDLDLLNSTLTQVLLSILPKSQQSIKMTSTHSQSVQQGSAWHGWWSAAVNANSAQSTSNLRLSCEGLDSSFCSATETSSIKQMVCSFPETALLKGFGQRKRIKEKKCRNFNWLQVPWDSKTCW